MSSLPGLFLEDFIEWAYYGRCVEELTEIFEPDRERVEQYLSDFDEETQSWRDYASYSDEWLGEERRQRADALLEASTDGR